MEISTERYREIEKMAKSCFKFFKTRNPLTILKLLEVECSFINLEGDIGGFTNTNDRNGKRSFHVYINTKYDSYSQKIIAAHELGHVLLHSADSLNMFEENGPSQLKEYEANIFAMELMPQLQPQNESFKFYPKEMLQDYVNSKLFYAKKQMADDIYKDLSNNWQNTSEISCTLYHE